MWGLFADNLLPMFLVAGAGYLLRATLPCDPRSLSHLAFYVFTPCLVFHLITSNELVGGEVLRMAGLSVVAQLLPAAFAWWLGGRLGWAGPLKSGIVLAVLLPNAGNLGLSATLFALGDEGLKHATVFFITSALLTFTVGVLVASLGRAGWREALAGLVRVPPIWALVVAVVCRQAGWALPVPVERTVELLSSASIPTMLVVLGVQLHGVRLAGPFAPVAIGVALRLGLGLVVGIVVARWMGLSGVAFQAGVLQAAMPTAIITTVIATEYDSEPQVVTSIVLVGTLLSPLTLTPLLSWLGG